MSRSKHPNHRPQLRGRGGPLCVAGKPPTAWIVLADQDLEPRTGDAALPPLPPSFLGRVGDRIELMDADARLVVIAGDIVTSLSGLTIEVDNTDAEGRIVLADSISYLIENYRPRLLLDLATLTAAIAASLHEEYAGLFTTDDALAGALEVAAARSAEALWRMPLSKRQDYLVDSEIADVRNMGAPGFFGNGAGSAIAGAKFLERFTAGARWAHLDIAGIAWSTRPRPGIPRGATGYGVRLLDAFVDCLPA